MTLSCPNPEALIEDAVDKVLTQYRESPNLLALLRALLNEPATLVETVCRIPEHFDLDTAKGEQLTIIGKWLGWPRCHCAGRRKTYFGFECEPMTAFALALDGAGAECLAVPSDSAGTAGLDCLGGFTGTPLCEIPLNPVGGFCDEAITFDCGGPEFEEFCFEDDELYRRFLKVRRYQLLNDFRRSTLTESLQELFGAKAFIARERPGVITASAGRPLTGEERATLHLFQQVTPVAPGVRIEIVGQVEDIPFFGFGAGWGGLCESIWLQ